MTMQAALYAADTPIRQSLANLTTYFAGQQGREPEAVARDIEEALGSNAVLFAREERDGEVFFVTSRVGAYHERIEDTKHMFRQRLYEPDEPLPIDDISVVVSTTRPALTTVEPVFISNYWQIQAGILPPEAAILDVDGAEDGAEDGVVTIDEDVLDEVVAAPVEVMAAPVEAVAAPVAAPAVPAEVVPAPVEVAAIGNARTVFTMPDGLAIDLRPPLAEIVAEHGPTLETALSAALERDPVRRVVSFGRSLYPEANVANLGKNDLRRIRDYILEVGEPLLDTTVIADLYYHNPRQADYEGFRFSLNYRLSREKDFEFVGVEGARLWSTKGLNTIGTKRLKASEMGPLTSYLEEGYDDSTADQSAEAIRTSGSLTRLLTFFEWEYGVLPLDASLKALLPPLMLPEQRSAVLRFESPQHYTSYLVEMRPAAGNRGGWLQGLEEFFREHLVPGALVTISRGAESNIFSITYEEAPSKDDRLLTLDEKKNKLGFANLSYYATVDDDQLISQQRFGKLRNLKLFPMSDRRKADQMLEHVFETTGDQLGSRSEPLYWIKLADLYVGANVLRPFSRAYLLALLAADERFSPDEAAAGAYFYKPEAKAGVAATSDDEDEEAETPAVRRGGGRRYQDDDE
ncbi:MAG: hypothetical protein H7Y32_17290 [Chloroflexales bacterium]|nr:hypothetical protein [Chloroflexales bacterium]